MSDKSSHRRPINGAGGIRGRADGPKGPHVPTPVDPYLPGAPMPEAPSEETTLRAMVNDREARIQAMIRARVNPIMAQLRQALPVDTAAGIVLLIPNGDLHLPEETKPVPGEDLLMVLTSHRTRVRKAVRAWLEASQEEEPAPAATFRPLSVTELPAPDAIAIGRAIRKTLQEEPGGPQDVDSLIRGVLATLAQGYAL